MERPDGAEGQGSPRCSGTNRKGEPCKAGAGKGTDHVGTGNCKHHGGCTPTGRKHAMEEQARKAVVTYGLPRDISPTDALLEEVRYTAGHVAWLRERVAELEQDDLTWGVTEESDQQATEFPGVNTTRAAKPNVWLDLYMRERKHLVDVTKAAISAGIEERRVKLAEAQGALVASVIRRILGDLDLSPGQMEKVAEVVPRHLRALAG